MRKLAAAAVLALGVAAFVMGAARVGTYGGGSYAPRGASYQAGGAPAGWDTVVVIYTPQDVLTDDNNPASIDTSLVWGRTPNVFTTPATRDFARRDQFKLALAGADSVYRVGTGRAVPNFCWGAITSMDTSGVSSGTSPKLFGPTRVTLTGGGVTTYVIPAAFPPTVAVENSYNDGGRGAHLFYIPFGSRHPNRVTVVSATLAVVNSGNAQFTYSDSLYAVLMDNPNDNDWYTTKDVVDFANYPNMAHCSWNRQESTNGGGWWNGTNRWIWNPTLAERPYYWSWGSVSDWSGSRYGSEGSGEYNLTYIPTKTGFNIDVTDCVQAAINGTTNNGIIIVNAESGATTNDWAFYGWDQYAEAKGREPYLVIKYITKRYQKPFGSSEWAFVASTDDARYPANTAYTAEFQEHGAAYTIFVAQSQVGVGAGASTAAQIVGFRNAGMEVGSHSRWHKTTQGLTFWHSLAMGDTNAAGWDSLMFDVQPKWLYTLGDAEGFDFRADPYYAKSLALPESQLSPEVGLALYKTGYEGVRYKALAPIAAGYQHYTVANTKRAAAGDSLLSGVPAPRGRMPRNMIGLPTTVAIQSIFSYEGNPSSTQAELDSLKQNIRRLVYQVRGQNRGIVNLFWHDYKTSPSVDYGNEGVNANELSAVLDEVDALGGRYMTVSEYARWIKSGATAVDSPNRAAVPDTFESVAAQRVWFRPDGIDNRWIRGVK